MSLRNSWDDVEITDPQTMRALAHPVRLAILSQLQRAGPMTATQLSERVGASPSVASWHLRHLASFGLVADAADPSGRRDGRRRWWRAVSRGFRFQMPDGPEGRQAGRMLMTRMVAQAVEQAGRWTAEVAPRLDDRWSRESGSGNTRVRVTPAEARAIQEAIERVIGPYVEREVAGHEPGPDARTVRIIRLLLPELDDAEDDPS